MQHYNIHVLFTEIKFYKLGKVLKEAAERKIKALQAKIEERTGRIARIRKDYDITDADMIELLSDNARAAFSSVGSYTLSNKMVTHGDGKKTEMVIGAGVVNNINTETNLMKQEEGHVARLALIVRNIDLDIKHEVSFDELEYLDL